MASPNITLDLHRKATTEPLSDADATFMSTFFMALVDNVFLWLSHGTYFLQGLLAPHDISPPACLLPSASLILLLSTKETQAFILF